MHSPPIPKFLNLGPGKEYKINKCRAFIYSRLESKKSNKHTLKFLLYCTHTIISSSIFKDHFFVFKEVFSDNSVLMYGLYSRAACNQERLMMVRVRYIPLRRASSIAMAYILEL